MCMNIQYLIQHSQNYFPNLQIKYKNESRFMKFVGMLLFFNKTFMTNYTTTIGSTIYFPDSKYLESNPVSGAVTLLHELVHVYDSMKYTRFLFSILYLSPQILFLFTLPLMIISWKLIFVSLLFLLPLPSFFRMHFEKRAYLVSLYVLNYLIINKMIHADLDANKEYYLTQFKSGGYYFMWPFKNLNLEFENGVRKIKLGEKPYNDSVFNIIDGLLSKIEK